MTACAPGCMKRAVARPQGWKSSWGYLSEAQNLNMGSPAQRTPIKMGLEIKTALLLSDRRCTLLATPTPQELTQHAGLMGRKRWRADAEGRQNASSPSPSGEGEQRAVAQERRPRTEDTDFVIPGRSLKRSDHLREERGSDSDGNPQLRKR